MSVIAVHGFPLMFKLPDVVTALSKAVQGQFEPLRFKTPKGQKKPKNKIRKTCYIRLSEKLDAGCVVQQINDIKNRKFVASISGDVSDTPLGPKPKRFPSKVPMSFPAPNEDPYERLLQRTTDEILTELQSKYPGLYSVSKKYGHKLMQELATKVYNRVKEIADRTPETEETTYTLSRSYRRSHPHFGDFQLVLSTLHAVQDAAGISRMQLQEADIATLPPMSHMLDIPVAKATQLCNKYTEKIVKRMTDHINALESGVSATEPEVDIARKQVREEFKKMAPFLHSLVNPVLQKHFMPKDGPHYRIRVYGEPFLPNREVMAPFLARFQPVRVLRSTVMYNLLKFNVPPQHYPPLIAMDGTVLSGSKLIIRSSDVVQFKLSRDAEDGEENEDEEPVEEEQQQTWDDIEMEV